MAPPDNYKPGIAKISVCVEVTLLDGTVQHLYQTQEGSRLAEDNYDKMENAQRAVARNIAYLFTKLWRENKIQ